MFCSFWTNKVLTDFHSVQYLPLSQIAQLQQTINAKAEVESALTSKSKEVEYLKSQLDTLEKKLKDLKE